jgi:hypothetical protein
MYTEGEYLTKNPTWHTEDSPWKAERILAMMRRNRLEIKSVCEVGCGAGDILRRLRDALPSDVRFTGYDISPQAIDLCGRGDSERLEFHLGDFARQGNGRFDLVLAIDVFEHVEDYFGFLRGLRGKGGRFIFHIPLDISVQTVLRGSPILRARRDVGHVHYFTKETALATLTDCGYEVIDYFFTGGAIDLPARSLRAAIAKVPRKLIFKLNSNLAARTLGGFSLLVLAR